MTRAIDVARLLTRLAITGEEPDPLNHLRLQKLLYYTQGWHVAAYGRRMFLDRIEAWKNGPVVVEVYPHFKAHGFMSILPEEADSPSNLTQPERCFTRSIWDEYKKYSATQLMKMTHEEKPWREARRGLPLGEKSNEEITVESLRAFFFPLLSAQDAQRN